MLTLVLCVGRAGAQEERVVQAFERLGAVVKRDDTKPNRPVIALRFGLRSPIPDTTSELDKDVILNHLLSNVDVIKVTGAPRKEWGQATRSILPYGDQGNRCDGTRSKHGAGRRGSENALSEREIGNKGRPRRKIDMLPLV
jgi:hypothetical protein